MEYLLSALYTSIDVFCFLIFLGAFASNRFIGHKHWFIITCYAIVFYAVILLSMTILEYSTIIKVILVIVCSIIFGRMLYINLSTPYLILLVMLEYLLTYLLSFISLYISALVCNLSIQEFRQKEITPFVISSAIYYFLQVVFILIIRKIIRDRKSLKNNLRQNSIQILLYLLFPLASFAMLLVLLRITSRQGLEEGAIIVQKSDAERHLHGVLATPHRPKATPLWHI